MTFHILSLYKFVTLADHRELREPLLALMRERELKGTLILAKEGINGTVAGPPPGIDSLLAWLERDPRFAGMTCNRWQSESIPFRRVKVKTKSEIVTMGVDAVDPSNRAGIRVKPSDWNALISSPGTIVIDTRNNYEVEMGTFVEAINPRTAEFGEFPSYVEKHLVEHKDRNIAMFCTGGIRCEKATAYLRDNGFENVYFLEGGILSYLNSVDESESRWRGQCFVFDERIAVSREYSSAERDEKQ